MSTNIDVGLSANLTVNASLVTIDTIRMGLVH